MRAASFEGLLPLIPGTTLLPDDRLTDENNDRYVVNAVEVSSYGLRMLASFATT